MIVFEDFVYISRKNFNLYVLLLGYSLVTPASAASKKSLKFRNYFTDNVVIKSYDKKWFRNTRSILLQACRKTDYSGLESRLSG